MTQGKHERSGIRWQVLGDTIGLGITDGAGKKWATVVTADELEACIEGLQEALHTLRATNDGDAY